MGRDPEKYLMIEMTMKDTEATRSQLRVFSQVMSRVIIAEGGEISISIQPYDWYPDDDEPGEPIEDKSVNMIDTRKEEG